MAAVERDGEVLDAGFGGGASGQGDAGPVDRGFGGEDDRRLVGERLVGEEGPEVLAGRRAVGVGERAAVVAGPVVGADIGLAAVEDRLDHGPAGGVDVAAQGAGDAVGHAVLLGGGLASAP